MNKLTTKKLFNAGYTPVCMTNECSPKGCKGCKLSTAISVYRGSDVIGVHTPTLPLLRAMTADAKWQMYVRNYKDALKACPTNVMYLYDIFGTFVGKFVNHYKMQHYEL